MAFRRKSPVSAGRKGQLKPGELLKLIDLFAICRKGLKKARPIVIASATVGN